ncbi:hypothetical protein MKW94_027405, partial [Papaver nudicaule]|nr:hypothetical protein [Papaver nudicaule]
RYEGGDKPSFGGDAYCGPRGEHQENLEEIKEVNEEFLDFIEGRSQIPIPTYFIGDYGIGAPKILSIASKEPKNQGFKMDGLRVCENLFWLKGSGKFTLHGLLVVYLSGRHSASAQLFGTYSQDDVDALRAWAEEPGIVDLFLRYPLLFGL